MLKRSRIERIRDVNQLAAHIVAETTGEPPVTEPKPAEPEKHPAAVAPGKLGAKKSGPAWAQKLTPEQRQRIAREAAQARWAAREK